MPGRGPLRATIHVCHPRLDCAIERAVWRNKVIDMRLFSRRDRYYDLFEELADKIEEGGRIFSEVIHHFENSEPKVSKLKEVEHEADYVTHQVYQMLHRSFLTPLDREDIFALANKMDTILDLIESAAVRMQLYRVRAPVKELFELSRVLNESISEIKKIIYSVRNKQEAKTILRRCVEINTLENEADQILRAAMARLFEQEKDAIELIKWLEILQTIETATDVCEDVSNVVEGIVLKYG